MVGAERPSWWSRRRLALLIRLRQEAQKRLAGWTNRPDRFRHPSAVADVDRSHTALRQALTDGHGVCVALRAATADTWAMPWRARGDDGPPDRQAVLANANSILGGDWTVFGHAVRVGPDGPDWHAHPFSGERVEKRHFSRLSLSGDLKPLWEVNRHRELVRLAQAWALTGDRRHTDALVRWLQWWWAENPPEQGINYVSVLDCALRAIAWCWIWRLTADAPSWTDEAAAALLAHSAAHARHIARFDSIHHSPNTHLTGEALGLLYVGSTFPVLRGAAEWRARGAQTLQSEIAEQWLPDGMHYERSTFYHRYHLEFYVHARLLGYRWAEADRLLHRGLGLLTHLRTPGGEWPTFGDSDGGSTLQLWTSAPDDATPLLVAASAMCREPEWLLGAVSTDHALAWWMVAPDDWAWLRGATAREPDRTTLHAETAGYVIARGSWAPDAWYLAVDAGPHGGERTGHAHTDVGHVEIAHGSARLVVDAGSLTYSGDEVRRHADRSLESHATVMVAGDALAEPRGTFGWRSVAPTPDVITMLGDTTPWVRLSYRASESATHIRLVLLLPALGVVVVDHVHAPGPVPLRWTWPLALSQPAVHFERPDRLRLGDHALQWVATPAVTPRLEPMTWSPTYAQARSGTRLIVESSGSPSTWAVWSVLRRDTPATLAITPGGGASVVIGSPLAPLRLAIDTAVMPRDLMGD
jgi:hypothetical protein